MDTTRQHPAGSGKAAAQLLATLRSAVGVSSWLSPGTSWRTFGLGALDVPSSGLMTRLFGVRDLALGLAVRKGSPEVARAALRAGIAIDAVDVVASLLATRRGAPRSSLFGVGVGAAAFVGLGWLALGGGSVAGDRTA